MFIWQILACLQALWFDPAVEKLNLVAQFTSSIAFFFYGSSCLRSQRMIFEFERYRLAKYRTITGVLQILGSVGLIAGFFNPWFSLVASLGLSIQMFLGVIVRFRIRDSLIQASPALLFCGLNLFIFWHSLHVLKLI
ncbi:MAG: DoxX family protein [Bdellovibrionaceae bacterium]|nr:DoxX family protein [Pseudobdellovibrionaceae bacterium]